MNKEILGIDLGATNLRGGVLKENDLSGIASQRINASVSADDVLHQVFHFVDKLMKPGIEAIGIGVPGLVVNGDVYDVINIPSWTEIALQKLMEDRYHVPVAINNDANCFALGEFYFGKGKGRDSMIGLTIGTGLGSGIIINKKLYAGENCGAGEFGMIGYLDQCYEYYASGQFFQNVYGMDGEEVFEKAKKGDESAIKMYNEMGTHLGNAIKTILYATDVPLIVLGGSVSKAHPYFAKNMWDQIKTFAFKKAIEHLQIEVSDLHHSGIFGAAALCFS
jgi:glucokinase